MEQVLYILSLIELFSYDLEMKTREQNRNNNRTEIDSLRKHPFLLALCR